MKYFVLSEQELKDVEVRGYNLGFGIWSKEREALEDGSLVTNAMDVATKNQLPPKEEWIDKGLYMALIGVKGYSLKRYLLPTEKGGGDKVILIGDRVSFDYDGCAGVGDVVFLIEEDGGVDATIMLDIGNNSGWRGSRCDQVGGTDPERYYWIVPVQNLKKVGELV